MSRFVQRPKLRSDTLSPASPFEPRPENLPEKEHSEGKLERIAKYVPGEIVAGYTSLMGIVMSVNPADEFRQPIAWGIFAMCAILTPVYFLRLGKTEMDPKTPVLLHTVVSSIAFIFWAYALGGPFLLAGWHKEWVGAILLGGFTLATGWIRPKPAT